MEQTRRTGSLIARDGQVSRVSMRRQNGFTLIELLVVIAIIGILAAIIFPVYAQAKKGAYKSSDLSNMNALRTALQLYKADTGSYPPALLGYVGLYANTGGNAIPPNSIKAALYPKRVDSLATFRPALHRIADNQGASTYTLAGAAAGTNPLVVAAYWPTSPLFSATGNPADQRYGPDALVHRIAQENGACYLTTNVYYKLSGYDVAPKSPTDPTYESHYQLFWSAYAVPSGLGGGSATEQTIDCAKLPSDGAGSGADTPRQLGYTEPPEDTVVTWNPFFRDYANGAPTHGKGDLVLFLAGNARPMDSFEVARQSWAIRP